MHDLPPASLGLRRAKVLQGVEPAALEQLARECSWRRYEPGQTIFTRDTPGRDVLVIVAGKVRVTLYTASGKQVTFRDLGEGDSVGEITVIDDGRRSADVVALTDVVAAAIAQAQFRDLLARQPKAAEHFMVYLASLVRQLSDRVVELSTLGVQNRIHGELMRLAGEAEGGNERLISPAPRHVDIASRVSTTREQVTRELSALARSGLVLKHEQGLLVTDLALLRRMVQDASLQA